LTSYYFGGKGRQIFQKLPCQVDIFCDFGGLFGHKSQSIMCFAVIAANKGCLLNKTSKNYPGLQVTEYGPENHFYGF
jgi:hypothetical protein